MQVIFIDNYFRTIYLDFVKKQIKRLCFWNFDKDAEISL